MSKLRPNRELGLIQRRKNIPGSNINMCKVPEQIKALYAEVTAS